MARPPRGVPPRSPPSSPRSAPATGPPRRGPTAPESALSPSGSLAALREAAETGQAVTIVYVDNHGTRTERVVDPVSVEGGVLTAHDHRADDVRTFAVHRITAVRAIRA